MSRFFILIAAFTLVGCQALQPAATPAPEPRAATPAPQPKQMPVNDVKLTYVEQGKGVPVVFVHGAIADYRVWEPYREATAQRYRFVSYTQRYFGTDAWPDDGKNFSAAAHAADLAAFIRGLNAGPVHIVTWSYSGLLGTLVALEHPELVRSQVHFEPSIRSLIADLPEAKPALEEIVKVLDPVVAAAKSGDSVRSGKLLIEGVFALPPGGFDKEGEGPRRIWLDNARTVPPQFAAPAPPAITCDKLKSIKSPTLVVKGTNTYAFWSLISDVMARCMPASRLVVIPNVNHDGPLRDPAALSKVMLDFWAKN